MCVLRMEEKEERHSGGEALASMPYHSAGGPRTEQCLLRQAAVEQGLRGLLAPLRHDAAKTADRDVNWFIETNLKIRVFERQ